MITRFKISLQCAFGWGKTQTEDANLTITNEVKTDIHPGTQDVIVSGTIYQLQTSPGALIDVNCTINEDGVYLTHNTAYNVVNGQSTGSITIPGVTFYENKYYHIYWSLA